MVLLWASIAPHPHPGLPLEGEGDSAWLTFAFKKTIVSRMKPAEPRCRSLRPGPAQLTRNSTSMPEVLRSRRDSSLARLSMKR
jgi:hypothetical protein